MRHGVTAAPVPSVPVPPTVCHWRPSAVASWPQPDSGQKEDLKHPSTAAELLIGWKRLENELRRPLSLEWPMDSQSPLRSTTVFYL